VSKSAGDGFERWLRQALHDSRVGNAANLARSTGVADSTVSRWLAGTAPDIDQCRKLAGALGVPMLEVVVRAGHLTRAEAQLREARAVVPVVRLEPREALVGDDSLADDARVILLAAYDAARGEQRPGLRRVARTVKSPKR